MAKKIRKSSPALVVEFLGLPGAGKTSIQSLLEKKLAGYPLDMLCKETLTAWIHQKAKYKLPYFLFKNTGWSVRLFVMLWKLRGWGRIFDRITWRYILSSITIPLYIKYFVEEHRPDVLLLDQAMAQSIWAIWYGHEKPDAQTLRLIFEHIYTLVQVSYIYFDVPVEVSARRVMQREENHSRFDHIQDYERLKNMISRGDALMIKIRDVLKYMGYDVVEVSSEQHYEQISEFLYNRIIEMKSRTTEVHQIK